MSEDSIGDGFCDVYNGLNTERCSWDGGDCCKSTCPEGEPLDFGGYYYYYYGFSTMYDACTWYWDEIPAEKRFYDERHCADPNAEDYVVQEDLNCTYYFEVWFAFVGEEDYSYSNGTSQCTNYLYGANSARCNWDGGDCCESTCVERDDVSTSCGEFGYFCKDPNSTNYGYEDVACVTHTVFQDSFDGDYCHDESWAITEWPQYNGLANLDTDACDYDGGKCLDQIDTASSPLPMFPVLLALCSVVAAGLF